MLGRHVILAPMLMVVVAGEARAQQAPPTPPPPVEAEAEEEDEIIVTARRGDMVRIDRRDYAVRDDPAAQATEALDILGRIPAVSVSPSGEIRLLGGEGVTVQINGQTIRGGSVEQVLRSLTGNDIERIEVTTNPPASQSASSSAGIINIVTRDRFMRGFAGSLQGQMNTLGSTQATLSPSWAQGALTISGRLYYNVNRGDQGFVRRIENFTTGAVIDESGGGDYDNQQNSANAQFVYRLTPQRRISLTLDHVIGDNFAEQTFTQRNSLGVSSLQTAPNWNDSTSNSAFFTFKETGQNQSVLEFTSYFEVSDFANRRLSTIIPDAGPTTQYAVANGADDTTLSARLGYERPLGGARMLEFGASFDRTEQDLYNRRQTLTGASPDDYDTTLTGALQTGAAYATYQFGAGDWILRPGLRVESDRREVISAGAETDSGETRFFPSLHMRRDLSRNLVLDLSYSSRIQRPDFNQLDPTVRINADGFRGNAGNPDLEPTTTDAYEANITHQSGGSTYSVTLFDRISQDVVSPFTELTPGGALLTRPVNAGESEQRGLQAILRAPIGERWRYSLSANFLSREFDVSSSAGRSRRSQFEYSGNAQIEWRDPRQNEPGADQFQFNLQFQGPRATLQDETDEFFLANLSWRRRITDRLSSTVRWADVFDTNTTETRIRTGDAFDDVENRGVPPRVFFSLNYQFGSLTERPQQDQPPPPPRQQEQTP
jgi:outer membrane receptor for ferrienterochelin and colicin